MKGFWDIFLEHVRENPEALALMDGQRKISYGDLAARAMAVSGLLRRRNIGHETLVGLKIEKSAEYVIAMLGVWHAGAAFVPLPPSLPEERINYIAGQSGVGNFLYARDVEEAPPYSHTSAAVQDDTLAYVIYTSGSSGRPKGVMVEHRGIVNFIKAQIEAFSVADNSRCLLSLSVNFDASISDIGMALLSGASLAVVPDDVVRDGKRFLRFLHAERITHMDVPPSLLKALRVTDMPPSLRTIVIGGEVCPVQVVREWAAKFRLVNVYGPTETTVCSSLCLCDPDKWDKPLIGDPLPGVSYHIFDEDFNKVDEGELHIGGVQLARGYLGNAELSSQKFIIHSGERLYKTGDKVRRHLNGDIEFIGRIDRQFKLRGQLVEPGEIEARLLDYPGIERAVAIKKQGRLVAFAQAGPDLDRDDILNDLSVNLPAWMIPQDLYFLPQMPLTANGKPDFSALQGLPAESGKAAYVPAKTETEKKISAIWKNVLRHENFGVTDDFFSAGGDSLAVIRLTLEAERQGISFSTAIMSEYPTIRSLAAALEKDVQGADVMSSDLLRAKVSFDDKWRRLLKEAETRPPNPVMDNILLTGAAGFLGSRVLHELLHQTKATVYCLIRAQDAGEGLERIKAAFDKYKMPVTAAEIGRVVPLCGDLTKKDFGLSDWAEMSRKIDAIYHCAAIVNMTASCRDLWPANVAGTKEVLRFSCEGRRKALHYASTLSVFVSTDQNKGRLVEKDRLEKTRQIYGGYAQTKWVAEYMLLQVPEKACDIRHYRFGLLTGDEKGGLGPCNDFPGMFARGMASLGAAPSGFDDALHVDITPVDYAAKAMVKISLAGDRDIYHIANPESLSLGGLLNAVRRTGRKIQSLPLPKWRELAAHSFLTTEETAAILGLCRTLPPEKFNARRAMDLFQATDVVFDLRQTERATGMTCPAASDALMDLYMQGIFKGCQTPLKICIFGPESTGKSTLAEKLAGHYGVAFVPEYARELIFSNQGSVVYSDMARIARGQRQLEKQAAENEGRVLFCDTDILTTAIWSEWLFKDCPEWIEAAAGLQQYDFYFLMDVDTPWVNDVHRFLPDDRKNFFEACRTELEKRNFPYTILSGTWEDKFSTARAIVDDLMKEVKHEAEPGNRQRHRR